MDLEVYQRAREALGMTDRQVAASLGLTTRELRLWQETAPGGLNRLALARLLGVPQSDLWVRR